MAMQKRARATTVATLALALGLTAGGVQAQDDADVSVEMPVVINPGVCGEGGELAAVPVLEIGVIGPTVGEDDNVPLPDEVVGVQLSPPVMVLEETIFVTFDQLLGADPGESNAVVVRSGVDGPPVACGQLGGVIEDGRLAIGLRPLSDERFFGVAAFEDATRVPGLEEGRLRATVFLFQEQGPLGPLGVDQAETDATPAP